MRNFIILLIAFLPLVANTQTSSGLLVSDERYQEVPVLPLYSGTKYNEVPAKVSLRKYCPVPGDQGKSGSCVGWAIGYGALTVQRAILHNVTDQAQITRNAHSAAFLYNQVRRNKTDCSEGIYLEDGLNLIKKQGDCLETSFNYEKFKCEALPTPQHFSEAGMYRIRDYAAVFTLNEEPKNKIGKACKILATNTPIIVGMGVTSTFFEVLPGANTWNPADNEPIAQYHAMLLVGYNSVEKYVELLNSFGPSWGQNGFVRVPFNDFERLCRYAFVMVPADSEPLAAIEPATGVEKNIAPIQESSTLGLSGEFVFRQPAGYVNTEDGEEVMYFEEVETRIVKAFNGGYYGTKLPHFKVGDVFQLVARDIPRGRYVYVFSQSPDGILNEHFPKKKETYVTAGFVIEKTAEIVVPSEQSLLQLAQPGEDVLCILYSYAPIPDYEARLERVRAGSAVFVERVRDIFSDVLIEQPSVHFSDEKMAFSAISDPGKGKIATLLMLSVVAE